MPQERIWEALVAGLAVLLGLGSWYLSGSLPTTEEGYPGPALFPRILAVALVLGGLALLGPALWQRQWWQAGLLGRLGPVGLLLGALGLAPWLLSWAGLVVTAALYAMLMAALLGVRWGAVLGLGVGVAGVVQGVFVMLLKV